MKFKYDKSKGLLFFINPLLPVKGYSFMNICGIMFTRSEDYIKRMSQATVTHEKTHTKQILKANPGINNRVDYESSVPLESQVYSAQPNERHADTWGFRGANVNMKDANGNYYIDPNRQLKGTDIQEMRTKGAKIPSGFNTLNDDEIAKLHNTFASNTINKRSNTMLIAKRGVQIKRRIIK